MLAARRFEHEARVDLNEESMRDSAIMRQLSTTALGWQLSE